MLAHTKTPVADAIKTAVTALMFHAWRDVRFGSQADICGAKCDVRFTPNSDRESGLPQTVMPALPPKADMCGCDGACLLRARSGHHWIIWSARASSGGGTVRPSALAVLRLIVSSKFVGNSTGSSPGLSPLRILAT